MPYNQFVGVGEQTAFDTPVARTHFTKCHAGSMINPKADRQKSSILSANAGADPEESFDRGQHGGATIIIPSSYDDRANLKMYKHALGLLATSGPSGSVYTHLFTRKVGPPFAAGTVPTAVALSVELNYEFPDTSFEAHLLTGGMVKSLKKSWAAGEEVKNEYTLIGKSATKGAKSSSPTFPDRANYAMKFSQCTVSIDGNAGHEGVISGFEFTIDNGYEVDMRLGSINTQQPVRRGVASIAGTFSRKWTTGTTPTAKAIWDAFVANTAKAFIITLTGPTGYSEVIRLANCSLMSGDISPEEGQLQEATFPFEAYHDATHTAVEITAQNATPSI